MFNTEENAKTLIDKNLEKEGWDLINDVEKEITTDSETRERADYLLKKNPNEFLALIEAKKKSPNGELLEPALDQGKRYAERLNIKYIFSSDGDDIWFLNLYTNSRKKISKFYSKQELIAMMNIDDPDRNQYKGLPSTLRYYQKEAILRIIDGIDNKQLKMFLEMATGTGKTLTAGSLIEEILFTKRAKRVLFMVDRDNLKKQTLDSFRGLFQGRVACGEFTGTISDNNNRVLVTTVQKIYKTYYNEQSKQFECNLPEDYFDLIILDECHRSYYGEWHCILDYFKTIKVGLTATPAKLKDKDTYDYFGEPLYRYTYYQGVKDGILSPCEIYTIRTNVDMYGLNYDGSDFRPEDLEKKVNVPNRNILIVEEYRKRFPQNPKTIVFAVSIAHAIALARCFRNEFGEDSTAVIVSGGNKSTTEDLIEKFRDPNSKLKIACTVDMLSTGFDAPSVEVLVMARPTKSNILYYQMKGRGSRIYENKENGYKKTHFTILDFVDNVEHETLNKIFTGEQMKKIDEEDKLEIEGASKTGEIEHDTREDTEKEKITIADGIDVWVEQEEFLKENEQKLKEIWHNMSEQIGIQMENKLIINEFKTVIKTVTLLNKYTPITEELLSDLGIDLNNVRKAYNINNADIQTLIDLAKGKDSKVLYQQKKEEKFKTWIKNKGYSEYQQKFITACYNVISGDPNKTFEDIIQQSIIGSFGGIGKIVKEFGDAEKIKTDYNELKELISEN